MKSKNELVTNTGFGSLIYSLRAFLFVAAIVFGSQTHLIAQTPGCNMMLTNGLQCSAQVKVEWYTTCPSSTPCSSQTFNLNATSQLGVTCTGCSGTICNVVITLQKVAGSSIIGSGIVDYLGWYSTTDSGSTFGCTGGSTYYESVGTNVWVLAY
jgi:hypothetical protein